MIVSLSDSQLGLLFAVAALVERDRRGHFLELFAACLAGGPVTDAAVKRALRTCCDRMRLARPSLQEAV